MNATPPPRIFLLSPARSGGPRSRMLLNPDASFDLARRMRKPEGVPLGEIFAFLSGLYFRGKLAYGRAFARAPEGLAEGVFIITPSRGLVAASVPMSPADLDEFAAVPIELEEARYAEPLRETTAALAAKLGEQGEAVLLGSIATAKYVEPLLPHLGGRLLFPAEFVGRGDMSRGGLLLRAAADGQELEYLPVSGAMRRGARPKKLEKRPGLLKAAVAKLERQDPGGMPDQERRTRSRRN